MPMELVRKTIASLGMLGSFWFSSARPPRRNLGNFEFRHPCLDHIWHVETSTHTRVHVPREWHRGLHFHARSPEVILPMVNSPDFSTPLSMVSDAKTNAEQIAVFEVRRVVTCSCWDCHSFASNARRQQQRRRRRRSTGIKLKLTVCYAGKVKHKQECVFVWMYARSGSRVYMPKSECVSDCTEMDT